MINQSINKTLKKRIVILDGATGTELQRRGMPAGVCPEQWCLENPAVLSEVHADYCRAGADIIYTSTFGANSVKLGQYNIKEVIAVNKQLALLAKKAAAGKALVAGDIGPTGLFVKPFGNLEFEQAVNIFKEQARGLLAGGVDLLVIETMMDIQEARAALLAVKELSDIFTIVTMTYDKSGRTLNGTDPLSALITLQSLAADAVGCNCSSGPQDMKKIIEQMRPYATVPLVAKPNAGIPELIADKTVFGMEPVVFAAHAAKLSFCGAAMIGGCCGTTPSHIEQLKSELGSRRPARPLRKSLAALSSARHSLVFEKSRKLVVIGEKINPTGKKQLQEDLASGQLRLVHLLAKEQEACKADALDVNVGVSGQNEKKLMQDVVSSLSTISSLPLVIDSADPAVIEAALRIYPGRALINSISGDKARLKKLFALAKKYGAMFILLPLTGKRLPRNFSERKSIITALVSQAKTAGFSADDMFVDGLTMTLSCNPLAGLETLRTISWCRQNLHCRTIIGLSNISFGFPNRRLINAAFLRMAADKGLSAAIADPRNIPAPKNLLAEDLLLNRAKASARYIARYGSIEKVQKQKIPKTTDPAQSLYQMVIDGDRRNIVNVLAELLKEKKSAYELMQKIMIPAIIKVGELFDQRKYFLPQLIASAEAMKAGVAYLEPYFKKEKKTPERKGLILLATVSGDIHDIGKNIVGLLLKNHGFQIVDLGKDISCAKIIAAIRRYKPDIVGLSALMTTTMVNMETVVQAARKQDLPCRFMIGGAVVSEPYARKIGASYARDGVAAVRLAETLTKK